MIAHKHKYIFNDIPKAAGTSIKRVFMDDLDLDMDNRQVLILGENTNKTMGPRRVSHLTAQEMLDQHFISQELFDSYFKFTFVRHPVDRLYSIYRYRTFFDYFSFDTFIKIKLQHSIESKSEGFFFKSQFEFLSKNDNCLLGFVGKFENLSGDFKKVKEQVKLKNNLMHYNQSKNESKRNLLLRFLKTIKNKESIKKFVLKVNNDFLLKEVKDIIFNYYKDHFKIFGYNMKSLSI